MKNLKMKILFITLLSLVLVNSSCLFLLPTTAAIETSRGVTEVVTSDSVETENFSNISASDEPMLTTIQPILNLKFHFIDVGQGDATLIESKNQFMLIDSGEDEYSESLINYLKNAGVEKLNYIVATHPHADHIGGLDEIVENFDIDNILMPDVTHTTDTYVDLLQAIDIKKYQITIPEINQEFYLGDSIVQVVAPNITYADLNNNSIGLRIQCDSISALLYGDAETEAEKDILSNNLNIDSDILKIAHHGSDTSTSEAFLKKVSPEFAIISVGKNNSYGHPTETILDRIKNNNIKLFRTDIQSTIVLETDGKNIIYSTEPTTDYTSSTPLIEVVETTIPIVAESTTQVSTIILETEKIQAVVYITKTGKKYHNDGCQYLKQSQIEINKEAAIFQGYEACSKCNP